MCPFRSHSFRKVQDGRDHPEPVYAIRACICEVNKHHIKWMTNAIFDKKLL